VREYLRYYTAPATFSNALSRVQAATVLKAFDIIESIEGRVLRLALMANILSLRHELREAGLEYYVSAKASIRLIRDLSLREPSASRDTLAKILRDTCGRATLR
jgi:7-keto-8-aminopelargonate synthetase-like enzyme